VCARFDSTIEDPLMTAAAALPSVPLPDRVRQALLDLLDCGYGRVDCTARTAELDHLETELTYRPNDGEATEAFVARLLANPPWQDGDQVSFLAKRERLDLVRIRRLGSYASEIITREQGESPAEFAERLEQIARGLRIASRAG
jgi:hypothetical protein